MSRRSRLTTLHYISCNSWSIKRSRKEIIILRHDIIAAVILYQCPILNIGILGGHGNEEGDDNYNNSMDNVMALGLTPPDDIQEDQGIVIYRK